ncbi:uncharacterized protein [Triticum aestivum]|uniref:uncharacterized protein n=1 Tax=Triticum aestivum TaxID=4565 RepID=UPI001D014D62|nr:uncharacterized protein LOC123067471 [Triticum aestivum]
MLHPGSLAQPQKQPRLVGQPCFSGLGNTRSAAWKPAEPPTSPSLPDRPEPSVDCPFTLTGLKADTRDLPLPAPLGARPAAVRAVAQGASPCPADRTAGAAHFQCAPRPLPQPLILRSSPIPIPCSTQRGSMVMKKTPI